MPSKRKRSETETAFTRVAPNEPTVRNHVCVYCYRSVKQLSKVRCAECEGIVLCLDCFASGASVYPHSNTHRYTVEEPLEFPLFRSNWTAEDELALLNGMIASAENHGCITAPHSWADVAEHIGSHKHKFDVAMHYKYTYLQSANAPLPDTSWLIGKDPMKQAEATAREKAQAESTSRIDDEERKRKECAAQKLWERGLPVGRTSLWRDPPQFPKPNDPRLAGHSVEYTGFNSKRGDFDHEFDLEAESLLAELEFRSDDTDSDREQKQRVLNIYSKRLDDRLARKAFLIDRGQLNIRRTMSVERNRQHEEREACARLRVFARFNRQDEHEGFVMGTLAERRIRQRIEQLQHMRMLGARTIEEGEERDSNRKLPATLGTRMHTMATHGATSAGASMHSQKSLQTGQPQMQPQHVLSKMQHNASSEHLWQQQSQQQHEQQGQSSAKTTSGTATQQQALRHLKSQSSLPVDPSLLPCGDLLTRQCVRFHLLLQGSVINVS